MGCHFFVTLIFVLSLLGRYIIHPDQSLAWNDISDFPSRWLSGVVWVQRRQPILHKIREELPVILTAIVHLRSFELPFVGHRTTTISHPTYTVQFYILVESAPDAPSGGFDALRFALPFGMTWICSEP